ncbi:hypothetical protein F511_17601 [Dorcoceras hygrometricum]|uniref:Uncharacterized protein n=1 Tax=Dorcoceras hygrometricum TaxID=472368 RepID=A0A2Z7AJM5_9LAMI|nr:hypothetical protein F511_17601 [Dorcoceras hygrometricum]
MKRRRAEESANGLALMTSSVTSSYSADGLRRSVARISRRKQQQHPVVSYNESAVATHPVVGKSSRELQYPVARNPGAKNRRSSKAQQLKNESAAKQLTIYESWMSTAERNSNGKNAQDGKNQWLRFSRANCLNSREQDLYYSGKQYNLQRMFARIWKVDKLAISSAEQIRNLSNGHISNRGYIFEKRH